MNTITFGNVDSSDYGIYVAGPGMYNKPARKVEYVEIPGRNGSLAIDEDTFEDIDIRFQAVMPTGFKERYDNFCAALNAIGGFAILSEGMHPDSFWMGSFSEALEPKPSVRYEGATFDIIFHCKPQRFLMSGLAQQNFTANGTLTNPTLYTARPNIRVYGYGNVGIGSQTITVAPNPWSYIDIDCEAMDARYGANNANSYVSVTGDSFPVLKPGSNGISLGTNISRVQIQPRWWTV